MTDPLTRLTTALADRYRIEREIGSGGMATVYLAQDLKHDRKVAVKVLKPELAAVLGAERFLAEIKTTANLQHPHILPLYDSGEADGFLFYVMPYVEGESLQGQAGPGEAAPGGGSGADREVRRQRPGLRPPPGGHPPGHQTGQHPASRRPAHGGRLRHRPGGEGGRRGPAHRDRALPGHAPLHEPGAGRRGSGDRRPERRLLPGLCPVRDAGGGSAPHGPDGAGHHQRHA